MAFLQVAMEIKQGLRIRAGSEYPYEDHAEAEEDPAELIEESAKEQPQANHQRNRSRRPRQGEAAE